MAKFLNLQVPNGCNQDWNEMKPCNQGRFCNSCQKNVLDFTQMTDRNWCAFFNSSGNLFVAAFLKSNWTGKF